MNKQAQTGTRRASKVETTQASTGKAVRKVSRNTVTSKRNAVRNAQKQLAKAQAELKAIQFASNPQIIALKDAIKNERNVLKTLNETLKTLTEPVQIAQCKVAIAGMKASKAQNELQLHVYMTAKPLSTGDDSLSVTNEKKLSVKHSYTEI